MHDAAADAVDRVHVIINVGPDIALTHIHAFARESPPPSASHVFRLDATAELSIEIVQGVQGSEAPINSSSDVVAPRLFICEIVFLWNLADSIGLDPGF